ncbi:hypothetical protein QVD17_15892 [Tagetes erecta]|uniref:Uncharacterized protein n=1 Tax=Tagetes erecta TaxID=13708 RepID=A0AAD8KQZ3_TARER|nr:hypothetical protein QVD17_15892 [Tagetes erecta]
MHGGSFFLCVKGERLQGEVPDGGGTYKRGRITSTKNNIQWGIEVVVVLMAMKGDEGERKMKMLFSPSTQLNSTPSSPSYCLFITSISPHHFNTTQHKHTHLSLSFIQIHHLYRVLTWQPRQQAPFQSDQQYPMAQRLAHSRSRRHVA